MRPNKVPSPHASPRDRSPPHDAAVIPAVPCRRRGCRGLLLRPRPLFSSRGRRGHIPCQRQHPAPQPLHHTSGHTTGVTLAVDEGQGAVRRGGGGGREDAGLGAGSMLLVHLEGELWNV